MKRNIVVKGINELTKEDYLRFIDKCYEYWCTLPVKNVDLIIEYQADFEECTLRNTNGEYIWGMIDDNPTIDEICNFAENELHICKPYIIARIRNGKIIDF